jgi:hypothetical protein
LTATHHHATAQGLLVRRRRRGSIATAQGLDLAFCVAMDNYRLKDPDALRLKDLPRLIENSLSELP